MLPILLMQMLIQNKLFLAVVPLQRSPAHIALGQLYQHNPLPGPGLASRHTPPPPHTESKLRHSYIQLYLGKNPDNHNKAEQNPGLLGLQQGGGLSLSLGSDPPNFCPCHLPDQPQEAKSSQGPSPGPQLLVLGLWDPRTFPKIAKLQPWFVDFIPFHSKGFRNKVQLTGPKKSLKIKQLTHQRVKLMQFF